MDSGKPQKIAINHDNYHAEHVGKTHDGFQFFLTTPFEPTVDEDGGCEYIALFKFDTEGNLSKYTIDILGPRGSYSEEERKEKYFSLLSSLGKVEYCRIEIKPFNIEYNGVKFGLIPRKLEDEVNEWIVELLPGNYIAFLYPWDSGEYDT